MWVFLLRFAYVYFRTSADKKCDKLKIIIRASVCPVQPTGAAEYALSVSWLLVSLGLVLLQ